MRDSKFISLSQYCLESVAQQIERYEPESFSTIPDKTLESIWDYLKKRYREAALTERATSHDKTSTRTSVDLFLWLLKAQTQSLRASQSLKDEEIQQVGIQSTIQRVPVSELVAYLPTSSPLMILPLRPTPDFTLLTTLTLSSDGITDSTLLPLRHLTRLFFLFLISCPGISDAGIKSLAMSLEYKDIVLSSTTEKADHELPIGRGCWRLRGIWLDGCSGITERAEVDLAKWPFLNIICELVLLLVIRKLWPCSKLIKTRSIALRDTQSTTANFLTGSGWDRAIPADATFSISRTASRYGHRISGTCVERKISAYHRRWPGSMACVKGETRTIGLVEVIGTGRSEGAIIRNDRPSVRSLFSLHNSFRDTKLPSSMDEAPATLDMTDRSTAFATDHGSASWLRNPSETTTSRKTGDEAGVDPGLTREPQYFAEDLAQLYVRHAPTLNSVRKALLEAQGKLKPRAIVKLEGKRPPSAFKTTANERISSRTSTSSPRTASPASSSPFSINTSSAEITILRQNRQGRHTISVPIPYSVPNNRLATRRMEVDGGWDTPGTLMPVPGMSAEWTRGISYQQNNKRSAPSQPEVDPPSTNSRTGIAGSTSGSAPFQPRTKGFAMFKRPKR